VTQIPVDRLRTALQFGQPQVISAHPVSEPAPPTVQPAPGPSLAEKTRRSPLQVRLAPDTSHIRLTGTSLATDEGWPEVTLNGTPVALSEADWDRIVIPIPPEVTSGVLEVALPGGEVTHLHVVREPRDRGWTADGAADPWLPEGD
jgi:hypothetical protein